MKIFRPLTILVFLCYFTQVNAQIYSAAPRGAFGFTPVSDNHIVFNNMIIHPSLMNMIAGLAVNQIKVSIARTANAPATDVSLWLGKSDDDFFIVRKITTLSLPANGSTAAIETLTFGDINSLLFSTGILNLGSELEIGLQFSNVSSGNAWLYGEDPLSPNDKPNRNGVGVYNTSGTFQNNVDILPASGFAIQVWGTPSLPVELMSFKGLQTKYKQSKLVWQTASEKNNQGFEIEKSYDGKVFETIGFVKGMGNSTVKQSYSYLDDNFEKSAYYRLKQMDFDGKTDYSKTIFIENQEQMIVKTKIYPNPNQGKFFVEHSSDIISMTVFSISGQILMNKPIENAERSEIDISNFANGHYWIRLNNSKGQYETKQIIIAKD
jgi:hypothetical protein